MKAKEYAEIFFKHLSDKNVDLDDILKVVVKSLQDHPDPVEQKMFGIEREMDVIGDALKDIVSKFMSESSDIAIQRAVKTEAGFIAVMKEQSNKWKAFARIINTRAGYELIEPDGLRKLFLDAEPLLDGKL